MDLFYFVFFFFNVSWINECVCARMCGGNAGLWGTFCCENLGCHSASTILDRFYSVCLWPDSRHVTSDPETHCLMFYSS